MAKNTLTVTHAGQTFSRTTDRRYTHVVLAKPDYQVSRAHATTIATYHARVNYDYAVQEADSTTRQHDHSESYLERYSRIAQLPFDQYAQSMIDERVAYVDDKKRAGVYDEFVDFAWCRRPDLAAPTKARAFKRGYAEVVIVELPIEAPPVT